MFHLFQFSSLFLCFLFHPLLTISLQFHNSSIQFCRHEEKMALLHFKNAFTVHPQSSDMYHDVQDFGLSYPKTNSWKVNRDCCLWDGVTCDSTSGHVIGLDLSCSQLSGIIHHNSTLFHLSHLQSLNLAYNNFHPSCISSNFGHFSNLKVLNLSHSGFIGDVPIDFSLLFHLVSLDLTVPSISVDLISTFSISQYLPYTFSGLKIPHVDKIIRNFTNLRQLHLSGVMINSTLPQIIGNLSSLSSLQLFDCNLQGVFHSNILTLPHLRFLTVESNPSLYLNPSLFNNLSTSLEVIKFSYTNSSGRFPEYTLESRPPRLRNFLAMGCNIYGTIPLWIWNTTELICLQDNNLTGKLPSTVNTKELSQLSYLDLSNNLLEGPIPSWLMNLPSLKSLYLDSNHFVGEVLNGPFPKGNCSLEDLELSYNNLSFHLNNLSKCNNLISLQLSYVSVIRGVNSIFSLPSLLNLEMSSCNITEFPHFLNSQQPLYYLDLSNNGIQGEIPSWLYNVGKDSMFFLNISHNNLTGGLDLLSWKGLEYIDLRSNSLQGLLPLPPLNITVFLASSNNFQGEITSSFCDLTQLSDVDLSNNHLNGKIPECLGKLSHSLELLDLGSNKFHGVIPMTFTKNCTLKSINLNNNQFEGTVPLSLKRCKSLEVLDLGNNRFDDSFPHWLDNLPELKVLVLQSNNFHGSIRDEVKANKHPFPKLQILDLSHNQFSGNLPATYISNLKALIVDSGVGHTKTPSYIGNFSNYNYQDSLVLTMKGSELKYKYILSTLKALDFSNNRFSGEIPYSVGKLVALVNLNVSHNHLTGHIPLSLSNLTSLQSLDLSCNKFEGKIPPQLVRLTFLEDFNVSENQLIGSIPGGNQFNTFSSNSYGGNLGLCGDPLPKCRKGGVLDHGPATPASEQEGNDIIDIITSISLWEIILIGFGLGATLGLVVGYYMLSSERPNWFSRKADKLEYVMVQRSKKLSRRRQRRT